MAFFEERLPTEATRPLTRSILFLGHFLWPKYVSERMKWTFDWQLYMIFLEYWQPFGLNDFPDYSG
jgi:hypothetical protein